MPVKHEELLRSVFCDVIEKLAFMFAEAVEREDIARVPVEYIEAHMEFKGPMSGIMRLAAPLEMCPLIAANVLGMEPDDADVQDRAIDALKELLNVICGNVLTAVAGEQPVFDLTVPETQVLDANGWATFLNESETIAFLVEDEPVLLQLSMKG